MPALPDVPNVIRFEMDFLVGTDAAALTRFFFAFTGGVPTPGDMASFAGLASSAAAGVLPAVMHPDTSLTEVRATDLTTAIGNTGVATTITAGTEAGSALGADVCVLYNEVIGRRYRGGKPRGYWPLGTAADLLTRQTWEAASITAFEGAINDIKGGLDGFTSGAITLGGPVNVSYYGPPNRIITGSTGRVRTVSTVRAAPLVDAITGASVNSHLGSQRRRNLIRT